MSSILFDILTAVLICDTNNNQKKKDMKRTQRHLCKCKAICKGNEGHTG